MKNRLIDLISPDSDLRVVDLNFKVFQAKQIIRDLKVGLFVCLILGVLLGWAIFSPK